MKRILIIGGGPSGIAAALSAAEENPRADIVLLEGLDRIGKKILATGNGRCNLGNASIAPEDYHAQRRDRLEALLEEMPTEKTTDFFRELGLLCTADEAGRLYPYCHQASMVLDVLLLALEHRGVQVECGCRVEGISHKKGRFQVRTENGERFEGDCVILACGGKAAPKQGITGVGYELAARFGHRCGPLYPCLVPIKCRHSALRGLKGIRVDCKTTIYADGAPAASEEGEVQLTDYGISGIPAMQLSCYLGALKGREIEAGIDFFPAFSEDALYTMLKGRAEAYPKETLERLFFGSLNKRVLYALMKEAGMEPLSRRAESLTEQELRRLAQVCKDWRLGVEGTLAWEQAQVTGGGIGLDQIGNDFASSEQEGLYLVGELLDAAGTCGGYNLHWAWCSGMIAGRAAAREETT